MSTDKQVISARDYLDRIRNRQVTDLDPSVLARECAELRRILGSILAVLGDDADPEPYCTTCGEWAGLFLGMEGWHHFKGDPAPGGKRELYDAGHEAVIAWVNAPGRAIPPGQIPVLAAALDEASGDKHDHCAECPDCTDRTCTACARWLRLAGEYDQLAALIRGAQ